MSRISTEWQSARRRLCIRTYAKKVTIHPAILTAVYAGEISKGVVTVTGFVNGETANNAESYTAPTVESVDTSTAGTHTLTPAGGAAKNCVFEYVGGTLTVIGGGGSWSDPDPDPKPDPTTACPWPTSRSRTRRIRRSGSTSRMKAFPLTLNVVPQTGEPLKLWPVLGGLSTAGLAVLTVTGRKKKEDGQ